MEIKKVLKVTSNIVTNILFVVLLMMLALVMITKTSGDEASIFGYQLKTVLSGSMEPIFKTGSVIALKTGGDMTRFDEGDVIMFRTKDGILVTHRIAEVKGKGQQYITKGDANDGVDLNPVFHENIVGEYTGFTVPYIGYVFNFTNTREGAALLLILPGIFFISYSIITIGRTFRQVKRLVEKAEVNLEK